MGQTITVAVAFVVAGCAEGNAPMAFAGENPTFSVDGGASSAYSSKGFTSESLCDFNGERLYAFKYGGLIYVLNAKASGSVNPVCTLSSNMIATPAGLAISSNGRLWVTVDGRQGPAFARFRRGGQR